MPEIHVTRHDNGIVIASLNRPGSLNSLTSLLHGEFRALFSQLESSGECRALIITGAGKAFCAGQDLKERIASPGQARIDLGERLAKDLIPLISRIRNAPFPVVAAINGTTAGAGLSLALSSDIILAAASAKLAFSFINVGLGPDGGLSWILPRLVGPAKANFWLLTGAVITAEEAERAGLVSVIAEDEALLNEAMSIASRLARCPRRAIIEMKQTLSISLSNSFSAQMSVEQAAQRRLGFTNDYREGISAFLEKRKPIFESENK